MQKIANTEQLNQELREILAYTRMPRPERRRIASDLFGLAERVAGERLASRGTPLYGHDSEATAYNVDDYPYSFKLRCKIRYWLEMQPKKGFRFVSQTENPKTGRWNKPKASTYAKFGGAMYLDSQKHVQWTGIGEYTKDSDVLEFVKDFPKADFRILREFAKAKVKYLERAVAGEVAFAINGVRQPVTEEDIGRYRAELETWQTIAKLIH
jgi:hypothetical protein